MDIELHGHTQPKARTALTRSFEQKSVRPAARSSRNKSSSKNRIGRWFQEIKDATILANNLSSTLTDVHADMLTRCNRGSIPESSEQSSGLVNCKPVPSVGSSLGKSLGIEGSERLCSKLGLEVKVELVLNTVLADNLL
jgi:hypothetical protein